MPILTIELDDSTYSDLTKHCGGSMTPEKVVVVMAKSYIKHNGFEIDKIEKLLDKHFCMREPYWTCECHSLLKKLQRIKKGDNI